jgi:hypothetical protein
LRSEAAPFSILFLARSSSRPQDQFCSLSGQVFFMSRKSGILHESEVFELVVSMFNEPEPSSLKTSWHDANDVFHRRVFGMPYNKRDIFFDVTLRQCTISKKWNSS